MTKIGSISLRKSQSNIYFILFIFFDGFFLIGEYMMGCLALYIGCFFYQLKKSIIEMVYYLL